MSNKIKFEYLGGVRAERTAATIRELNRLHIPFDLHNKETHIIAEFPAVKMHIWSNTMKWRVGQNGTVKQGTRAELDRAMAKALTIPIPELETKTPEEIHQVKSDWLTQGYTPPQLVEGFEAHKDELVAFYHRTQKLVDDRVTAQVEQKYNAYLRAKDQDFHHMSLHQTTQITDTLKATKVYGGWLYTTTVVETTGEYQDVTAGVGVSTTFVPDTVGASL